MQARRGNLGAHIVELTLDDGAVALEKRTFQLRDDQLGVLRAVVLDWQMDDYTFSQNEVIRVALDAFLDLGLNEQIRRLEAHRRYEQGIGLNVAKRGRRRRRGRR